MLVAHQMLGQPVTREHGGPVRLYVAPMYGYKSLKWLDRVEVVDALDDPTDPGYWENLGYDVDAWVGLVERPPRRRRSDDDRVRRSTPDVGRHDVVVGDRVVRFSRAERWLHWTNATLFLVLLATGMTLYIAVPVGGRRPTGAREGRARLQRAAAPRPAARRLRGSLA